MADYLVLSHCYHKLKKLYFYLFFVLNLSDYIGIYICIFQYVLVCVLFTVVNEHSCLLKTPLNLKIRCANNLHNN